jgi:hypothetical protein
MAEDFQLMRNKLLKALLLMLGSIRSIIDRVSVSQTRIV